jgi:hypothetical protein
MSFPNRDSNYDLSAVQQVAIPACMPIYAELKFLTGLTVSVFATVHYQYLCLASKNFIRPVTLQQEDITLLPTKLTGRLKMELVSDSESKH